MTGPAARLRAPVVFPPHCGGVMTRSSQPPRRSFGPHTGAGAFLGGIGFVLSSPSVWPYACVPVLMALVLTCGLGYLGFEAAKRIAEGLFESWEARWLVRGLVSLVFFAVSALLGLVLAQPLSGFALEAIARKQEFSLTGRQPPEPGFLTSLWIGLRCTLFTLLVGGTITVLLFTVSVAFAPAAIVTVPLNFLVVGWFLAWDLIDYPL